MPTQQGAAYPFLSQRVVVFRHGERRDNHPDAPAESNPPLTEDGVAAVAGSAARLKHYLGQDEARAAILVVSPFLRTMQTAEALQFHGVGADHAMVIDNTLCEVFGPSRIKTGRAPQLQPNHAMRSVGGLPMWGESLETATQRYVANFLRNGDVYGGAISQGSSADGSISARDESQTSSTLVCPAAVTRRASIGTRGALAAAVAPAQQDSALASTTMSGKPRDVILVTHGDAISAVLSYFYPARVVYEADFLSFIIMRRYGVGNHVYHLDESAGVNWFVEGIDGEPQDLILRALEMEREAAIAAAASAAARNGDGARANHHQVDSADEDVDDFNDGDDDEGEALDDDVAEDAQPSSYAGSRMKSRTSRLPPRRFQPRVAALNAFTEATPSHNALPPTQVHPSLQTPPHLHAARSRRGTSASASSTGSNGANGSGVGNGATGSANTPNRTANVGGVHAARHHPKAGEDCERIRVPAGTPAQSSSDPVLNTAADATHSRRGHSSSSSSGGGGSEKEGDESGGDDDGGVREREGREGKKGGEGKERGVGLTWQPPAATSPCSDSEGSAPAKTMDVAATLEGSALGMSSYGGLTADPSINSWVKSKATSISFFSAVAAREKASATVRVVQEPPVGFSSVTNTAALSPVIQVVSTEASDGPPLTASTAQASRTLSRNSSALVSPAVPPSAVSVSTTHAMYGAVPSPSHTNNASFDDSATSVQPWNTAAAAAAAPDAGDDSYSSAAPDFARRIDRHKVLGRATGVSLLMRLVCLVIPIVQIIVFRARYTMAVYCVVTIAWEIALGVVLALSCRVAWQRVRGVRRAMEQLRWEGDADAPAARASNRQAQLGPTVIEPHEGEETPFHHFADAATSGRHYESSMVWQAGSTQAAGDDESTTEATTPVSRRSTGQVLVMCARHLAVTAAKLFALFLISLVLAMTDGVDPVLAFHSLFRLYSTALGLVFTLFFASVNVVRGVWDETRIDPVIDWC